MDALLSLLIADAYAQAGGAQQEPSIWVTLLPLILLLVIFYFLLIRPQAKRAKEHRKMVEALNEGDEVVTNGGLLGRIIQVEDDFVTLEVANKVQVRVQRHAVASLMPRGTYQG